MLIYANYFCSREKFSFCRPRVDDRHTPVARWRASSTFCFAYVLCLSSQLLFVQNLRILFWKNRSCCDIALLKRSNLVIHESNQERNNNDTVCFILCTRFGEFTCNRWCNLENLAPIVCRKINENIFPGSGKKGKKKKVKKVAGTEIKGCGWREVCTPHAPSLSVP